MRSSLRSSSIGSARFASLTVVASLLASLLASLMIAVPAGAQPVNAVPSYPDKAIRVLVPNTPGSAADVVARYVTQQMGEAWKQPVTVDNRAGAGGIVAVETVARAPADGYTLLQAADGPITILPSLQASLPYQPLRDLMPVASLGEIDFVLVANPKTGFHTLQDFVNAARREPGRYNYASAGNGSPQQFAMELLKQSAGIHVTHIPYRGGPPGMLDVVAGQVDVMFIAVGPALPHIKSGRLVALAMSGESTDALLPSVPLVSQTYKGFRASTWFGLFAPAGTPQPVVDAIAAEAHRILATPAAQATLAAQGIRATGYAPARFGQQLRNDTERYAALAKSANIRAD
jgi:tripartite-type tricarboxylate transporter receptor subunit TctC